METTVVPTTLRATNLMVVIILEQLGIIHVTEGTLVTGVLTAALATTPAMDIMLAVMRTGMWGTTLGEFSLLPCLRLLYGYCLTRSLTYLPSF